MAFQWFDYERTGWLSNGLIINVPDGFQWFDYERNGWLSNGLIMNVPDGFPMV
jgi:hypothetical protein